MAEQHTTEAQQAHIGPAESMPESVAETDAPVPDRSSSTGGRQQMGTRRRPGGPVLEESTDRVGGRIASRSAGN